MPGVAAPDQGHLHVLMSTGKHWSRESKYTLYPVSCILINNLITFKLQTFTRPECNWRAFEDVVMKLPESGSGNSTLLAWWLQQQVFQLSESEKKQTAFHDLVTDNLDFNL